MWIVKELLGKHTMAKLEMNNGINQIPNTLNDGLSIPKYPQHYLIHCSTKSYKNCRVCLVEGRKKKSAYKCEECSALTDKDMVFCIIITNVDVDAIP